MDVGIRHHDGGLPQNGNDHVLLLGHLLGDFGQHFVDGGHGIRGHQILHPQPQLFVFLGGLQIIARLGLGNVPGKAAGVDPRVPQNVPGAEAPVQIMPQFAAMAQGDVHGNLVGVLGRVVQGGFGGVHGDVQADFPPVFHIKLAGGDVILIAAVVPDLYTEGIAVGGLAIAVAVDVLHAHFVQQGVGALDVIRAIVQFVFPGQIQAHHVVDLVRVDGAGNGFAEADVAHHVLPGLGSVVLGHGAVGVEAVGGVHEDHGHGVVETSGVNGITALFLVFQQQGVIREEGFGDVDVAADYVHELDFVVFLVLGLHIIKIGQLLAVRVHLEIIGIAHPVGGGGAGVGHDPGIQNGEVRVDEAFEGDAGQGRGGVGQFPVGHVHLVEHIRPHALFFRVVIPQLRGEGLQEFIIGFLGAVAFFRVIGMELLEVMGGLEHFGVAAPALDGAENQEAAVGLIEGHLEGPVVDPLKGHGGAVRLAAGAHVGGDHRGQLLVHDEAVVGEFKVFHGHRLAVGPLQPLTEVEGEDGVVLVGLIALEDVADDLVGIGGGHAQQGLVAAHEHVGIPVDGGGTGDEGAAVVADFVIQVRIQHFVHQFGLQGQALCHRGKRPGFHLGGQNGRFCVGFCAFRPGAHGQSQDAQRQNKRQNAGQLLHSHTS